MKYKYINYNFKHQLLLSIAKYPIYCVYDIILSISYKNDIPNSIGCEITLHC